MRTSLQRFFCLMSVGSAWCVVGVPEGVCSLPDSPAVRREGKKRGKVCPAVHWSLSLKHRRDLRCLIQLDSSGWEWKNFQRFLFGAQVHEMAEQGTDKRCVTMHWWSQGVPVSLLPNRFVVPRCALGGAILSDYLTRTEAGIEGYAFGQDQINFLSDRPINLYRAIAWTQDDRNDRVPSAMIEFIPCDYSDGRGVICVVGALAYLTGKAANAVEYDYAFLLSAVVEVARSCRWRVLRHAVMTVEVEQVLREHFGIENSTDMELSSVLTNRQSTEVVPEADISGYLNL